MLNTLKANASVFAAFKHHNQISDMASKLLDESGKLRSFSAFKKAVAKITNQYSNNWLRAEYNHAVGSSRMAAQWKSFEEKGGMLGYYTIGDGRVREEHRVLHGTVLPVDDPFWDSYYPPNGWNCRCYVRWKGTDATPVQPKGFPPLKTMFKGNVGKGFNPFDNTELLKRVTLKNRVDIEALLGTIDNGRPLIELYMQDTEIELLELFKDGGYIFRHKNYDRQDYDNNLAAAIKMTESTNNIVLIREHFIDEKKLQRLKDMKWVHKNAEFSVNGAIADLKSLEIADRILPDANTFFNTCSKGINKQKLKALVIDISLMKNSNNLDRKAMELFRRRSIVGIHLIRNGSYTLLNRNDYENNLIAQKIKRLFQKNRPL